MIPKPRPQAKMGRSWIFRYQGVRWRVKRLTRRGFLEVIDFAVEYPLTKQYARHWKALKGIPMLKPKGPVAGGTSKLGADDASAWAGLPNWRSFFLDQTYGFDDSERAAGLLIVKPSKEGWQWTLKETSCCLMLRVTSRTWDEGILLIEEMLGSETAPWETDPYESAKRAKSRGRKS